MQRACTRGATAVLAALALTAPAAIRPQRAAANGDPASDVLLIQDFFFPYRPHVSPAVEAAAFSAVRAANAAGVHLKVAVIGSALDLGLVPNLFGHPQSYAQFLDREITYNQPQPLLVVMPAGFGTVPASLAQALSHVPLYARQQTDGLTRSAILAVVAIARFQGHPIAAPSIAAGSARHSAPTLLVFGLPVALLVLAGLGFVLVGRARARRTAAAEGAEPTRDG